MTVEWNHGRRIPGVTPDTEPFWSGAGDDSLQIQYCSSCRRWQHPPSPVCRGCRTATDLAFHAVSGRGRVASWTENQQSWYPDQEVPFCVGFVELEEQEGLYVFTGFPDLVPGPEAIGTSVALTFAERGAVRLPLFRVAEGGTR